MYPVVPEGSVRSPALARNAFAVGAVGSKSNINEAYARSSWGPTDDDDRKKPEVVAPGHAESGIGETRDGTSVAAAFAAGFAALIKQITPLASGATLAEQVRLTVEPLGQRPQNNQFGFGFLRGDKLPALAHLPGAPTGDVELPREWGGWIEESTLEVTLRRGLTAKDGPDVRVVTGSDAYNPGDGMKVGLRSLVDCHCLLLLRNEKSQYKALSVTPNVEVKRETDLIIPSDSFFTVRDNPGFHDLIAVCATRPYALSAATPIQHGTSTSMFRFEIQ